MITTLHRTSDGIEFGEHNDAFQHEKRLTHVKLLTEHIKETQRKHGLCSCASADMMIHFLQDNTDFIRDLLDYWEEATREQ